VSRGLHPMGVQGLSGASRRDDRDSRRQNEMSRSMEGLVPMWLSFAARLGLGRCKRVARVATARLPPNNSSAKAKSAGNASSATTPPLEGHDLFARGRMLAETGSGRCIEIWRLFLAIYKGPLCWRF
jgi:hypothetical protein